MSKLWPSAISMQSSSASLRPSGALVVCDFAVIVPPANNTASIPRILMGREDRANGFISSNKGGAKLRCRRSFQTVGDRRPFTRFRQGFDDYEPGAQFIAAMQLRV